MTYVAEFNKTVTDLLARFEKKARTTDERNMLYRLRNRIAAALSFEKTALIAEAAPVLTEFSSHILVENKEDREKFFLSLNVRAEYAKRKSTPVAAEDEYIFSLTDMIKKQYSASSPAERDAIYQSLCILLADSADFLLKKEQNFH